MQYAKDYIQHAIYYILKAIFHKLYTWFCIYCKLDTLHYKLCARHFAHFVLHAAY